MISGKDTAAVSGLSFEAMLDDVCDRLLDRKAAYSLRRIREMDAALAALEGELDELILRGRARFPPGEGSYRINPNENKTL